MAGMGTCLPAHAHSRRSFSVWWSPPPIRDKSQAHTLSAPLDLEPGGGQRAEACGSLQKRKQASLLVKIFLLLKQRDRQKATLPSNFLFGRTSPERLVTGVVAAILQSWGSSLEGSQRSWPMAQMSPSQLQQLCKFPHVDLLSYKLVCSM